MKEQKINLNLFFVPLCGLLIVYVVLRALNVSFTHDEGMSYNVVRVKDYFEYAANNHMLNTWLMAVSSAVFGQSELALRLPNVLLFLVYLFFCYRLLKPSKKAAFLFFAFPLLFLNPFVLDFFSLARGYGISLGFMAASLYYFLRRNFRDFNYHDFVKDFAWSMLFATLALLSNLALINFYIALMVLFSGNYILCYKKDSASGTAKHLPFVLLVVLACVPLLLSVKRLLLLSKAGDLYVGAGSFDESISSFIERSCYFEPYPLWFTEVLQTFIKFIFPVGLIITLLRKNVNSPLIKLGSLITIILTGVYLEHYLFSTLFPLSRTGIYFIPLFGFFLYYLFIQFIENLKPGRQKIFTIAGLLLVALPLSIHFFKTMNLKHTFEWKYETHTKEIVFEVERKNKKSVLGHNWIFGPAINYYIHSRNLELKAVKLEGGAYDQDFVYEFRDQLRDSTWKAIIVYDDIGSGLYKNPDR